MAQIPFWQIEITDEKNIPIVMSYLVDFLEDLNSNDFSAKKIHQLTGIVEKFIALAKHYNTEGIGSFQKKTEELVAQIIEDQFSGSNEKNENCRARFNEINKSAYKISLVSGYS